MAFFDQNYFAQPSFVISCGGLAGSAHLVARASERARFGGSSPCSRSLHIDFAGGEEPRSLELEHRYGAGNLEPFQDSELFILDSKALIDAAMNELCDDRFDFVWNICPKDLVKRVRTDQAGQIPSLSRAALWLKADQLAMIFEECLSRLAPIGEMVRDLRRNGLDPAAIGPRPKIYLLVGAQGGTGTGSYLPVAILLRSVADRLQLVIDIELHLIFDYRATADEESLLRLALGEQTCRDVTLAQTPGNHFTIKTFRGAEHSVIAPVFRRVVLFEAPQGNLHANAEGLALVVGEAIAFRKSSRAAVSIATAGEQNILSRTRKR